MRKSNVGCAFNGKLDFSRNWKYEIHWSYCFGVCAVDIVQAVLFQNVSLYYHTWTFQWIDANSSSFKSFWSSTPWSKGIRKIKIEQ